MQTLQYGNNMLDLEQQRQYDNNQIITNPPSAATKNNWLNISPKLITLHGMLLTSSFNI